MINLLAVICQVLLCVICMYGFLDSVFMCNGGQCYLSPFMLQMVCVKEAILSPHLFNVYVHELSIKLDSQFFGCHISNICYNHLVYADDTVLLVPSPKALQMLIDIYVLHFALRMILYTMRRRPSVCVSNLLL